MSWSLWFALTCLFLFSFASHTGAEKVSVRDVTDASSESDEVQDRDKFDDSHFEDYVERIVKKLQEQQREKSLADDDEHKRRHNQEYTDESGQSSDFSGQKYQDYRMTGESEDRENSQKKKDDTVRWYFTLQAMWIVLIIAIIVLVTFIYVCLKQQNISRGAILPLVHSREWTEKARVEDTLLHPHLQQISLAMGSKNSRCQSPVVGSSYLTYLSRSTPTPPRY